RRLVVGGGSVGTPTVATTVAAGAAGPVTVAARAPAGARRRLPGPGAGVGLAGWPGVGPGGLPAAGHRGQLVLGGPPVDGRKGGRFRRFGQGSGDPGRRERRAGRAWPGVVAGG